jgi:hypothetical protein
MFAEVLDSLYICEKIRIEASVAQHESREKDSKEEPPDWCIPLFLIESFLLLQSAGF